MSNVLNSLLRDFARQTGGVIFSCYAEGHARFLCDQTYVVNICDNRRTGNIHLLALAGRMPSSNNSTVLDLAYGKWIPVHDRIENFMFGLLQHEETGTIAVTSSAPPSQLDAVTFGEWLESFVEYLTTFTERCLSGLDEEKCQGGRAINENTHAHQITYLN